MDLLQQTRRYNQHSSSPFFSGCACGRVCRRPRPACAVAAARRQAVRGAGGTGGTAAVCARARVYARSGVCRDCLLLGSREPESCWLARQVSADHHYSGRRVTWDMPDGTGFIPWGVPMQFGETSRISGLCMQCIVKRQPASAVQLCLGLLNSALCST
eukprot:353849-Chlamydomonas_euryale.AAC.10